jgi:SAM-dependent methyltransferase
MSDASPYGDAFYQALAESARRSARVIVPRVLALLDPKNVIDIGCGAGAWLSVFAEHGVTDFLGVDGDFVPRNVLQIPPERFVAFDLSGPYRSHRRFDLVTSLEVAEHLPPECAASFVDSLVRLGPAVLFSAAIPGQGGTEHVNEQWQSYWAGLFQRHDYIPVDCVRRTIWDNRDVAWWYSQNTLLYCERSYATRTPALSREMQTAAGMPLNIVHPSKLEGAVWKERLAKEGFQLARTIPSGEPFFLVDQGASAGAFDGCGIAIPFLHRDGVFAGIPADSQAVLTEMKAAWPQANYIVVIEPALWWLTFYSEWAEYLRANSQLVLETKMMKVFRKTSGLQ